MVVKEPFRQFYEQYAPYVKVCALARMSSSSDAEDLQSIVWMDVHKRFSHFTSRDSEPKGLLYRLVQWRAVDLVRRQKEKEYIDDAENQLADRVLAALGRTSAERADDGVLIKQVLSSESVEDRAIVVGRYVEGKTWQELAYQLDMHRNTICRRAEACLRRLRSGLEPEQREEESP